MHTDPLEIVWTKNADAQLNEVHDYIAAENPSAAERVVAEIRSRIEQVAGQPGLGFKSSVRFSKTQIREVLVAP